MRVYDKKLSGCKKTCTVCNLAFTPTGLSQKYCATCGPSANKSKKVATERVRRIRVGMIKNPGVGKGGVPHKGVDHPGYKNGIGMFQQYRKNKCENCGGVKNLDVHHIDEDRTHNTPDNLRTLCRSCHRKIHRGSPITESGRAKLSVAAKLRTPHRKRTPTGQFAKGAAND